MASFDAENLPPKVAAAATRYTFRREILHRAYPIYRGPNADGVERLSYLDSPTTEGRCIVYYINGMMTSPASHERTANYLAGIIGHPVIGLYNLTGIAGTDPNHSKAAFLTSLGVDGIQSLIQYATPIGRALPLVKEWLRQHIAGKLVVALGEACWPHLDLHQRVALLRSALIVNLVSTTLIDRLACDVSTYERIVIVAHSQGNLSAANTLWALTHALCERTEPLAKIHMIGLASPNPSWPTHGLNIKLFSDPRDPVASLSVKGAVANEHRKPQEVRPAFKREFEDQPESKDLSKDAHDVMRHMTDFHFQKHVCEAIGLKT